MNQLFLRLSIVFVLVINVSTSVAFGSNTKIQMALTVDDLPQHGAIDMKSTRLKITEDLLATIKSHKIPNVYGFINAHWLEESPLLLDVLSLWNKNGLPLGNHTYQHLNLDKTMVSEYIADIEKNDLALSKLNKGLKYKKYFRYPQLREGENLEKRNAIRNYLTSKNYLYAPVTIDYKDYFFNSPVARCLDKGKKKELAEIRQLHLEYAKRILQTHIELSEKLYGRQIPQILLIHIGLAQSLWFDDVAKEYEKAGISWQDIDETLQDPVYKENPQLPEHNGGLFLVQIARTRGIKTTAYPGESELQKKLDSFCK